MWTVFWVAIGLIVLGTLLAVFVAASQATGIMVTIGFVLLFGLAMRKLWDMFEL